MMLLQESKHFLITSSEKSTPLIGTLSMQDRNARTSDEQTLRVLEIIAVYCDPVRPIDNLLC